MGNTSERRCGKPAKYSMRWPGKAEATAICEEHARFARHVAAGLGFELTLHEVEPDSLCEQITGRVEVLPGGIIATKPCGCDEGGYCERCRPRPCIAVEVERCPRCMHRSGVVRFESLGRPVHPIAPNGMRFTHWALCSVCSGPILLCVQLEDGR